MSVEQASKNVFCALVEDTIDCQHYVDLVRLDASGASVAFAGTTRNTNHSRGVSYLWYEAYADMALEVMHSIGEAILAKHEVQRISLTHRLGRVDIGEASVHIVVASAHRKAAFMACHEAIDELKRLVPIWKKEYLQDGNIEWIANAESHGIAAK